MRENFKVLRSKFWAEHLILSASLHLPFTILKSTNLRLSWIDETCLFTKRSFLIQFDIKTKYREILPGHLKIKRPMPKYLIALITWMPLMAAPNFVGICEIVKSGYKLDFRPLKRSHCRHVGSFWERKKPLYNDFEIRNPWNNVLWGALIFKTENDFRRSLFDTATTFMSTKEFFIELYFFLSWFCSRVVPVLRILANL